MTRSSREFPGIHAEETGEESYHVTFLGVPKMYSSCPHISSSSILLLYQTKLTFSHGENYIMEL